ncbi:MAG: family N-acetyltransferase [Microbacterium sp.]|jgi:RimJ/RimL family protein N-acetyltransferase|nr:family N-acetyltransferase [Microbacterium sp.]
MLPRTARLALRPMVDDDLPALRDILCDDVTMSAYEGGFDEDEVRAWLQRQQDRYRSDGFGLWAVVERETGEMIGQTGPTRQRIEDDEVVEVGYLFRRDRWGRGYAGEAASACVDWAFANLPTDAVWAKVRDTNLASMNVAIRLGMRVRRRFVVPYRGVRMPHLGFAVSRAEWAARGDRATGTPAP